MKVLFLDDMEERHVVAMKVFWKDELTRVYTAKDACDAMAKTKFNIVCLDHDLKEEHYTEPLTYGAPKDLSETGTGVAEWMAATLTVDKRPDTVVIHTLNPSGRNRMLMILNYAGFHTVVKPFTNWRPSI